MVDKTWTNEPGKWRPPVMAAPQEEGWQVWLCLKIFLFIFSSANVMHAFGLGAAMALEHTPTWCQRSTYVSLSTLFFFKKKQGQFLTESGAYLKLDCMPTKLLRRASPTAAITQAAVLVCTTMPPSFLCECQGSELRASCFCSKHLTHWPMFLANQPMLKKELGLTQRWTRNLQKKLGSDLHTAQKECAHSTLHEEKRSIVILKL